jgi:DNA-damage-inducible protein J
MKTTNVSFRMDEELKRKTEQTLDEIGLNMSSAFTVFAKAIVRTGAIPFELKTDPFFHAEHQNELNRRIELFESGKSRKKQKIFTTDELSLLTDD